MSNPSPILSLSVRVDGTQLDLGVEVTNTHDEPIFLMVFLDDSFGLLGNEARPFSTSDCPPTKSLAYVFFQGPQTALILSGDSPLPNNVSMYAPRRPYGLRLESGKTFSNTFSFKTPLLEWYAYNPPTQEGTAAEEISQIRYRLAWIASSLAKNVSEFPGHPNIWRVSGLPSVVEGTCVLTNSVPLLRRTDPGFERPRDNEARIQSGPPPHGVFPLMK